jgi:hypothetical protein
MTKKEVITNIFDEIAPVEGQETVDIWGDTYLPVQWQNLLGKWECPLEHWGGSMLEFEYEIEQVRHQANMVDGFLLDSISIAPFAYKVHWGYRNGEGQYIMAEQPLDDVNPWRSRVHILALMKEAQSVTPVILTAGSNTGKHLLANVRQGQRRIANMLKRIDRPGIPTHLFWMEMIAGKPVEVGEGEATSTICPPVTVAPANVHKMTPKVIAKYLTGLYVGHDIKGIFDDVLWDEGQEWAAKQPERLLLDDGTNGGDNVALPPPLIEAVLLDGDNVALPPPLIEAVLLDDGSLHIPDLSEAKEKDWITCAMSIPGLFNHRNHANRAFSKMLRDRHLQRASKAAQWEAWKIILVERWRDLEALNDSQNREAGWRGDSMAQVMAEILAMDEVEAHDTAED